MVLDLDRQEPLVRRPRIRLRRAPTRAVTPAVGPESLEGWEPPAASATAVAIGPACNADSCGGEAAPTAVVDAGSAAVSCSVSSHSQASGRSKVVSELCSSSDVNLLEVSSMLRIRSRPEVYADSSGVVASPARIGLRST